MFDGATPLYHLKHTVPMSNDRYMSGCVARQWRYIFTARVCVCVCVRTGMYSFQYYILGWVYRHTVYIRFRYMGHRVLQCNVGRLAAADVLTVLCLLYDGVDTAGCWQCHN